MRIGPSRNREGADGTAAGKPLSQGGGSAETGVEPGVQRAAA